MKILVAVKSVIDAYVKIRVKSDGSGVETQNVKHSMNPFDEIAVEEAVRLKEKGIAGDILAVSINDTGVTETLRVALALGADRGILVQYEHPHYSLNIAKILAEICKRESIDLVLLGKQAIDSDNNQTGQMLAALLDWPQACFASHIDIQGKAAQVTREIDGGLETLALNLPAVITTDLRLNEPRYATLPNIMKAKRKVIDTLTVADLNLNLTTQLKTLKVEPPRSRPAGVMLDNVTQLVEKLRTEGVLS